MVPSPITLVDLLWNIDIETDVICDVFDIKHDRLFTKGKYTNDRKKVVEAVVLHVVNQTMVECAIEIESRLSPLENSKTPILFLFI